MRKLTQTLFLVLLAMITSTAYADNVAKIGTTEYATLQDAINAANAATSGQTVVLLKDVDATGTMSSEDSRFNLWIKTSITIDGDGHKLTVKGRGIGVQGESSNIDVTFQNITITNKGNANGRCIDTRGKLNSLTINNSTLTTAESSYTGYLQPLTIGGDQSSKATVAITNSNIIVVEAANKGYAITTFNPVKMTIDGCTIKGWACLNIKGPDSSAGSKGSIINVTNSTLVSANGTPGYSNSYSLIKIEDDNVTVNISNCDISVNGSDNTQSIVSFQKLDQKNSANSTVNMGEGNDVTLEGDYRYSSNEGETSELVITGGEFNVPIPEENCGEGLVPTQDAEGNYIVGDEDDNWVATIESTRYATLAAAIQAVGDNETITMIADEEGPGIRVAEGKNFTVDFNGHTYTLNAPAVGSTNTETLGFQLLKNSTITFKNGTINIAEENKTTTAAKPIMRVIQNYANLTLENMTIDGTNMYGMTAYVVSFNNGTSEIKGNTTITSDNIGADEPIIDCCQYSTYPSTNLKINTTGTIGGNIEISASNAANAANSKLEIINANVKGGITKNGNIDVPVAVSGGTFEAPIPEEYCAAGFEPATLDPVTGVYTVASKTNDVVLYDNATSIPAVNNKTVCLADRTLYAGMWNTICLPFGIGNFEGTAFAGAEVREFTGASLAPDTKTLDLKFENTVNAVQAGVPYVIKPAVDVPNPTFKAVNITATQASYKQGNDALAKFVGTFVKTSIPGGKEYLFITKGNSLVYITDGPFDYPGFRAYFQVTEETAAAAQTLRLSFDEGDTTAINGVETKAETTTEDWYTISGAKLQGKPAQKGIYIMNGKKVVVK